MSECNLETMELSSLRVLAHYYCKDLQQWSLKALSYGVCVWLRSLWAMVTWNGGEEKVRKCMEEGE